MPKKRNWNWVWIKKKSPLLSNLPIQLYINFYWCWLFAPTLEWGESIFESIIWKEPRLFFLTCQAHSNDLFEFKSNSSFASQFYWPKFLKWYKTNFIWKCENCNLWWQVEVFMNPNKSGNFFYILQHLHQSATMTFQLLYSNFIGFPIGHERLNCVHHYSVYSPAKATKHYVFGPMSTVNNIIISLLFCSQ